MSLDTIKDVINKYNMDIEDQKDLLKEYQGLENENDYKSIFIDKVLTVHIPKVLSKRKWRKFVKLVISEAEKEAKSSGIVFHKFQADELVNEGIVLTGVTKNILKSDEDTTSWMFLKQCIRAVVNGLTDYGKDINALVDYVSNLYELAVKDVKNGTEAFVEAYKKDLLSCQKEDINTLRIVNICERRERCIKVLYVLNQIKEYKNTGKQMYMAISQKQSEP